jgi:hypothetical protein
MSLKGFRYKSQSLDPVLLGLPNGFRKRRQSQLLRSKVPCPDQPGLQGSSKKAEPILTLPSPCIKYHNSFQKVLRNFWEKIVGQNA